MNKFLVVLPNKLLTINSHNCILIYLLKQLKEKIYFLLYIIANLFFKDNEKICIKRMYIIY